MATRRALLAAPSLLLAAPARAQAWPDRPVRILVGFSPGGFTDILARVMATALQARLGQPFLVENRPGASGMIAAEAVAKAPPDGHLLLMGHPTALAIAPALALRMPFDADAALAPVTLLAQQPHLLLVKGDAPWRGVQEMIAEAKRRPGALTYASSGVGSVQHIQGEQFCAAAGVEMVHVPYRGSGPTMTDIAAGQVHCAIDGVAVSAGLRQAGGLRAIATSAPRRVPSLAEIPTLAEQGIEGVTPGSWFGLVAPGGTPAAIIGALQRACAAVLPAPEVQRAMQTAAAEPSAGTPEEFLAFLRAERQRFRALAARARISLD